MCVQDVLLKNLYIESLFHNRENIDNGKPLESWDFQQLSAMAGTHVCVCMYVYTFIRVLRIFIITPSISTCSHMLYLCVTMYVCMYDCLFVCV